MKLGSADEFEVVRLDTELVVVRHRQERHEFTFRMAVQDSCEGQALQLLSFFEAGRPFQSGSFVTEAQAFAIREVRRRTFN